jgi:large subunit ribosomal protein L31e
MSEPEEQEAEETEETAETTAPEEPQEEETETEVEETTTPETVTPEETEAEEEEEVETAPAAEKKEEGEAAEEEIEVVEEKTYTIPLRHAWVVTPRGKRAPRAVRDVRAFVSRHMKAEEVAISNDVNSAIWARSINKPPRKIMVRAVKDKEGKVIVYPAKKS